MTFKDQLKKDSAAVFFNTSHFGEEIVYTPYGGSAKTIRAMVNRNPSDPMAEGGQRTMENTIEVFISTDATHGISSITLGEDKVQVADDIGGAVRKYTVQRIIAQDEGMWQLLCNF